MTWLLDGFSILFILFLGYNGFNRGLIEELGRLVGLLIAILISISNTKLVSDKMIGIVDLDDWIIKILNCQVARECFSMRFGLKLSKLNIFVKMVFLKKEP